MSLPLDLTKRAVECVVAQDGKLALQFAYDLLLFLCSGQPMPDGAEADSPVEMPADPKDAPAALASALAQRAARGRISRATTLKPRTFKTPHGDVTLSSDELAACAEFGAKPATYAANKARRAAIGTL